MPGTGLLSGRHCAYKGISTSPRPGPFRDVPGQRVFFPSVDDTRR
jgi:hypothetical protein